MIGLLVLIGIILVVFCGVSCVCCCTGAAVAAYSQDHHKVSTHYHDPEIPMAVNPAINVTSATYGKDTDSPTTTVFVGGMDSSANVDSVCGYSVNTDDRMNIEK